MKKWYVWIVAWVVVAVGLFATSWIMSRNSISSTLPPTSSALSPSPSVSMASYTNAQGQKWSIETGDYGFTVTSAESYPKFVSGDIDPLKVSIGETQHMSIVLRDTVPFTQVWAEVETDNGTDTIPLTAVTSSVVSYDEIQNQKYLVDSSDKLVVNDGSKKSSDIANLIESLVEKVQAEQAVDYSYAGSWVVHDTRNITYHTTFYALDTLGRTRSIVLAWSDPSCTASGGLLQFACNLTATWGVDGSPLSLNRLQITMQSGGTLVYNSGQSLILPVGSSIVGLSVSTPIVKANLYYPDYDGDGWASGTTMSYNTASSLSHYIRVSSAGLHGTTDCDDYNGNTYPGQTSFFSSAISDSGGTSAKNGTFDYNCDGKITDNVNTPDTGASSDPTYDSDGTAPVCTPVGSPPGLGWTNSAEVMDCTSSSTPTYDAVTGDCSNLNSGGWQDQDFTDCWVNTQIHQTPSNVPACGTSAHYAVGSPYYSGSGGYTDFNMTQSNWQTAQSVVRKCR